MRFKYRYFLPKFFNFVPVETQEKYSDTLDSHRQTIEAALKDSELVPAEYIDIEVEVELRIL